MTVPSAPIERKPRRSRLGLHRLRLWLVKLLRGHLDPRDVGLAIFIGFFIGVLPIYGVHLWLCILVARWRKLNQAIVYAVANVSNPVFAPFLIATEVKLGGWLRKGEQATPTALHHSEHFWDMLKETPGLFIDCLIGSVVIGLVAGPILGLLGYAWALQRQKRKNPPAS